MVAQINRDIRIEKEYIMDDISNKEESIVISSGSNLSQGVDLNVDEEKMAALRAKLAEKIKATTEEGAKMAENTKVMKKDKAISIGCVGSGQCGSKIVQEMYTLGYDSIAINTNRGDLANITLPESNKLLLEYGLGGMARDIASGKEAAEAYRDQITDLISTQLADSQLILLALSLGGGSGAGSAEILVDIIANTIGKALCVITVLPMDSEDAQVKSNALITLSKLTKPSQAGKINNLIVVDNAKIEAIYSDVGQMDFFKKANAAIVEPLDIFNTLSAMPSDVKPLDPSEFGKLMTTSGLTVWGALTISDYSEEDSLALGVMENLNGNLLASGFDLKQAKYAGVIFAANEKTWRGISTASVNYALATVNDQCGTPDAVFKGVYAMSSIEDGKIMVYSIFSGLGLPDSRINDLQKEVAAFKMTTKEKDIKRNMSLNLDNGIDQTISKVQEMKNKIANKNSAFNKLTNNSLIDRRKK